MSARRTGLVVSAITVVVLAAGAAVPGTLAAQPDVATVEPIGVDVPAGDRTLVCPEPIRPLVPGTEGDPQFSPMPVGSTSTVTAATVQALAPAAAIHLAPVGGDPIAAADDITTPAAILTTATETSLVLAGQVTPPLAAAIAGTAATTTTAGDLRGLAAAACLTPGVDHWLVGADTTADSSTRLVVTNPSVTAATVEVEILGPAGNVLDTPRTFAVAPMGSESLLLDAVAPGQSAVVVHVVATGAKVATWLQTTRLRGLTPAGTDYVVPGAAPGTALLIGPVPAAATAVDARDVAVLRLLAPDADTTATVTLFGPDGPVDVPGLDHVDLVAGQVLDVSLGGIPANPYVVAVTADAPVVAGALAVDTADDAAGPVEIAWAPAAATAALDASGVVAIPAGTHAYLIAALDGPDPVAYRLRILNADGTLRGTSTLTLEPGAVAAVPVAGPAAGGEDSESTVAAVAIDQPDEGASGQVSWSVLLLDPRNQDLFAAVQPTGYPAGETTVEVRVE